MGNQRYMNIEDEDLDQAAGNEPEQQFFDEEPEQFDDEPPRRSVRSEAVKRIQKAKLYETLLSHSLFAPGSADAEILEEVEQELKSIIEEKLEELLGMRAAKRAAEQVALPFDEDQIEILKLVADRALKRGSSLGSTPTPTINPVQTAPEPAPRQAETHHPAIVPVGQTAQPAVRRQAQQQRPAAPAAAKPRGRRRPTENTSEKSGRDLSQAASRRRPPRPMPSQGEIDAMNARQADKNARAPKVVPTEEDDPNGGMSTAHVGALLAKVLQGQGGS